MIYDKIKADLANAMKLRDKIKLSVLRVLVSDIQRKSDKDYNDDYVISTITKTLKFLAESYSPQKSSAIEKGILTKYLPTQISEKDIIEYLDSIDFNKINPMAAIGMVINRFPKGSVTGKQVKTIITNYTN
jgi:uncharacterized protein YqeY